jgi:hypothetical protein
MPPSISSVRTATDLSMEISMGAVQNAERIVRKQVPWQNHRRLLSPKFTESNSGV